MIEGAKFQTPIIVITNYSAIKSGKESDSKAMSGNVFFSVFFVNLTIEHIALIIVNCWKQLNT